MISGIGPVGKGVAVGVAVGETVAVAEIVAVAVTVAIGVMVVVAVAVSAGVGVRVVVVEAVGVGVTGKGVNPASVVVVGVIVVWATGVEVAWLVGGGVVLACVATGVVEGEGVGAVAAGFVGVGVGVLAGKVMVFPVAAPVGFAPPFPVVLSEVAGITKVWRAPKVEVTGPLTGHRLGAVFSAARVLAVSSGIIPLAPSLNWLVISTVSAGLFPPWLATCRVEAGSKFSSRNRVRSNWP